MDEKSGMNQSEVLVAGAGIFGVTAVLELLARGHKVTVLDPGPLPHPLAASTDISKVVRMEYGADEAYMILGEQAREGWLKWNETFEEPLYHEVGLTMLTKEPMASGGYAYESYQRLNQRGHFPERLTTDDLARRFPAWKPGSFTDGFYHAKGGYAESGRVVEALIHKAQALGAVFEVGQTAKEVVVGNGRVTGLRTKEGQTFYADHVLIAMGAWTPTLIPELQRVMKITGHPVFHLKPADPSLFTPPHFTVFMADIANSGWYGFPLHPKQGVVKIANHGVGQILHPSNDPRVVTDTDIRHLRNFLGESLPALHNAQIVYTRRCLYCDTLDEHFWIDRHPEWDGLTVAAGGSGHAFKFAPILGHLIVEAIEGRATPKFAWRPLDAQMAGQEAARHHHKSNE